MERKHERRCRTETAPAARPCSVVVAPVIARMTETSVSPATPFISLPLVRVASMPDRGHLSLPSNPADTCNQLGPFHVRTVVVSDPPFTAEEAAAQSLLAKVREFVAELTEEEASLFAALIAPGVAMAYGSDEDADEVSGFVWRPGALPQALARTLVEGRIRVEGL
jgi:hypothetical protein